jgi:hypothetical protein
MLEGPTEQHRCPGVFFFPAVQIAIPVSPEAASTQVRVNDLEALEADCNAYSLRGSRVVGLNSTVV